MKWIPIVERLPENDGWYCLKNSSPSGWIWFEKGNFIYRNEPMILHDSVLWLDESGSTDWEREAKEAWRKIEIYKDEAQRYRTALDESSQPSTAKWSDSDVKKFLEDYRVANMDCYLNPVIWFDKLNDEK